MLKNIGESIAKLLVRLFLPWKQTEILRDTDCLDGAVADLTRSRVTSQAGLRGGFREDVDWSLGLPCPSIEPAGKDEAFAFNSALAPSRHDYADSTGPVRYTLTRRSVEIFDFDKSSRREVAPQNAMNLPNGATAPQGVPLAVSYSRRREGDWQIPPEFDLVAANGARIIAKQRDKLRFFFTTVTDEFLHASPSSTETLPFGINTLPVDGFYTALDPEYPASSNDPRLSWDREADHNSHTSLAPFTIPKINTGLVWRIVFLVLSSISILTIIGWLVPIYGYLVVWLAFLAGTLASLIVPPLMAWVHSLSGESLVKTTKDLGLAPDVLFVRVRKNIWYQLDTRPPFDEKAPIHLAPFEPYAHVTYWNASDRRTHEQLSVRLLGVLDVGVGHLHRHQSYDESVGGELDTLTPRILRFYQAVYGPVQDAGGFVDGTCNFYLFAKVRIASGRPRDEGTWRDFDYTKMNYAVLWIDEQTYPTDRWHVLSVQDSYWKKFKGFAIQGQLDRQPTPAIDRLIDKFLGTQSAPSFDQEYNRFDGTQWWCPFNESWRDNEKRFSDLSRMSVAKQVIAVTGNLAKVDTPSGQVIPVIYTINASYGTMDRRWRWRRYPSTAQIDETSTSWHGAPAGDTVLPRSLRLREDMTLVLKGTRALPWGVVEGYWVQKYLPADNIERPSATEIRQIPPVNRPYDHAWRFVGKENFEASERFLQQGAYSEVNARNHFYLVDSFSPETFTVSEINRIFDGENGVWWQENTPGLRLQTKSVLVHTRKRSPYNERLIFQMRRRGPFGLIATHADKRDDELTALVPNQQATLTILRGGSALGQNHVASFSFGRRIRRHAPPAVQMAKVLVDPGQGTLHILFYSRMAGSDRRAHAGVGNWWTDLLPGPDVLKRIRLINRLGGIFGRVFIAPDRFYRAFESAFLPPMASSSQQSRWAPQLGDFEHYLRPRFADWNPSKIQDGDDVPDAFLWRLRVASLSANRLNSVDHVNFELFDSAKTRFNVTRLTHYLYLAEIPLGSHGLAQSFPPELTDPQRIFDAGTTLWFEDATGHVAAPEKLEFGVL